jgi:hypothetical protein
MVKVNLRISDLRDTSGKIEMQQVQVEKGNSPADENMCVLHDRKSE